MVTETAAQRATIVHGYSLAGIDRLTHIAVTKAHVSISFPEAREEAWQAIVELLYSCPERPSHYSLVDAGRNAVEEHFRRRLHDVGLRKVAGGGYEQAPRFMAYWADAVDGVDGERATHSSWIRRVGARPDWVDAFVERLALPQVMDVLTPVQREAIVALAATGDLSGAANRLNVSYAIVKRRVREARIRMLEAWFDDETPPQRPDAKTHCKYGHAWSVHGFPDPTSGAMKCRLCLRSAQRRYNVRGRLEDRVLDDAELVDMEGEALTFAPAPEEEPGTLRTAVNTCWCGLPVGHDWPHKGQGAAHPR